MNKKRRALLKATGSCVAFTGIASANGSETENESSGAEDNITIINNSEETREISVRIPSSDNFLYKNRFSAVENGQREANAPITRKIPVRGANKNYTVQVRTDDGQSDTCPVFIANDGISDPQNIVIHITPQGQMQCRTHMK